MAMNIKNEEGLWTLEVNEKFAYETLKDLEVDLAVLLDYKKNHGNYKQLKEKKRNQKILDAKDAMKKELKGALQGLGEALGGQ